MVRVLRASWALFLGIFLLMVSNALQGSLLGVRSVLENFSTEVYGFVSAAYFAGFLGGSQLTPLLIRRVGHVRVFAALGSMISAAFIIYVAVIDPIAWFLMRMVVGFCFAGVFIVAESWINDAVENEERGQAISAYVFVQMIGIVFGQQLLNVGDPAGVDLFILISVLVSLSIAPMLLSVAPAPAFGAPRTMSFRELFVSSPLGFVGSLFNGFVFSIQFGMAAVYGALIGLDVSEISILLTAIFLGAGAFQMPVGMISDRMDRRILIIFLAAAAAGLALLSVAVGLVSLGQVGGFELYALYLTAFLMGGLSNPLFALLIAHTNDFVDNDQRAGASSGLNFLTGLGALGGPIAAGYAMTYGGAEAFWVLQAALLLSITAYGLYRATQRAATSVDETAPYAPLSARVTAVGMEMAQEAVIEKLEAREEEASEESDGVDGAPAAAEAAR